MTQKPYDHQGRFIPLKCERCQAGSLQPQGNGEWACDGLADPGHPDLDLIACPNTHCNGEPYDAAIAA